MKFRVLGCGDAFGSGGRFNTCFLVETSRSAFLIDCGASSLVAMRRFGVDPNAVSSVFISHLHGDHFGGLPFLILDAQFVSHRQRPLTLVGPPGIRSRFEALSEVMFPGSTTSRREFELEFVEIGAETATTIDGVRVTPFEVSHPSGAPSYSLRFEADGKIICFSGDTEWVDALERAAHNADLFIAESYTFDKPVPYHTAWTTLREHLPATGAKRVLLTHMSSDMLETASVAGVERAEDGMVIEI